MVCYLCDVCGSYHPQDQPGALSIIDGKSGYTVHVCSGACERAHANRDTKAQRRLRTRARVLQSLGTFPELWVAVAATLIFIVAKLTH